MSRFQKVEWEEMARSEDCKTGLEKIREIRERRRKMRKKQGVGLLIALAAFLLAPAEGQAEILAGKGLPPPVIVIPEKAEMNNYKHAVGEWQEYLPKLCGIAPVKGKKAEAGGFTVYLAELSGGKPSFVPEDAAKALDSNPKEDAFLIRTLGGKRLLILGRTPRALLYGTGYFLDNYLGIKWFYPGKTGESVPRRETLVIPDVIDDLQSPFTDFRIAAYTLHDKKDVPWKPEDMVKWQHRNLVAVLPRAHQYRDYKEVANVELPGGGHRTLCNAVPNRLYEKHPEYFPLIDGERIQCTCSAGAWNSKAKRRWVHRCISNPAVKKRVVDSILKQVRSNPRGTFGISSADVPNSWCQCPECRKLGTYKGKFSVSNLYYTFFKSVTDEVLRQVPEARLWIYIYLDYQTLPDDPDLKFDKRVHAIYYAHGRCIAHRIDDASCEINRPFLQNYRAWSNVFSRVGLCDYYGNSNCDYAPHEYNFAADAAERIRRNDWGEREHITARRFFLNWLFYYVKMKLWWNPRLDAEKLVDSAIRDYYGKAASPMLKFQHMKRDLWKNAPGHAWYPGPDRGAYCLAVADNENTMRGFLEEAAELAKDDPLLSRRVAMEKEAFESSWVKAAEKVRADASGKRVVVPVKRVNAIRIDGVLDEEEWKKAEPVTRFISPYTKNALQESTLVRAVYDDDAWYISIECMNDRAWSPLKAKFTKRDDGRIAAEDDSVELFLCTPGDGIYYQFMVNTLGACCDAKLMDKSFDSRCTVAARVHADRYVVEMKIPVRPLNVAKILPGQPWKLHVWRNIRNLQPPASVDRGGIDGLRPHSDVAFYRPLVPGGKEVVKNGTFAQIGKNGFPEYWKANPERASLVRKDGKNIVRLRGTKLYQIMNLSETGHNVARGLHPCTITVTVRASGKGNLEFYPSTGLSLRGKKFMHKKKGKTVLSPLSEEPGEHIFTFDLAENEAGYIYIGARNADIENISVIKSEKTRGNADEKPE